jgi:RNA polymerase sigma-70 factor (ECF subfamily)
MGEPANAALRQAAWGDYVRRCASRDESALAALYDESSQLTYTIVLRILRDEADASEVVLDVYKQVWEAAVRFDERRGSAVAWIVTLARSRAMDRRRFRTAAKRTTAKVVELQDVMSSQQSPESLAIASQSSRSVMRALAVVPPEQRQALELTFFAGLSHSEIADRLEVPLGTAQPIDPGALYKQQSPAVLLIEALGSDGKPMKTGSGSLVTADGKFLTNHHRARKASYREAGQWRCL